MAYNPQTAISKIYNLKGIWETANNSGDTKKKNDAAAKAQEYYKQLRDNGYTDVADELTASNYTQAKAINDKWAKTGKTSTRDYMYSLGKAQGMSSEDIDKLISWDNQSGEVSFGGKKIGAPDAVVDGVSYWADTSVLDNAFNDYISRSGTTRSKSVAVDQENENLFAKYKQHYDDVMNTNPFTTEEAKAILAKYDLAGLQGRDNAVAENAPSNGGNIDSFAAANALRQQSALVNQGQMAVLDAHKQKLDHARALLSDMGVNIDRVFNQDETIKNREFNQKEAHESRIWEQNETSKNNDVARKSEIAAVTGTVPDEWVVSNNPYMNDDGTIKDEFKNTDFSTIMAKAKETGNTELYNAAATARFYKIMGNYGLYGQYDDGNYIVPEKQKTEAAKQDEIANKLQIASATGTPPIEWVLQNDPFYKNFVDENGKLTKEAEALDFQALINDAKAKGNTDLANKYAYLRGLKIYGNLGKYGQYMNEGDVATNPSEGVIEPVVTHQPQVVYVDTSDYAISNNHGDSWVYVQGKGRLSYQELLNAVENGTVKEVFDHSTKQITYKSTGVSK